MPSVTLGGDGGQNCKIYFFKLQRYLFEMQKYLFKLQKYLFKLQKCLFKLQKYFKFQDIFVQIARYICSNCKIYLCAWPNCVKCRTGWKMEVKTARCQITPLLHRPNWQPSQRCLANIFVQLNKYICQNGNKYLSRLSAHLHLPRPKLQPPQRCVAKYICSI